MKKKVNELCGNDLKRICKKYFHKDFYDSCKDCPLKVKVIHCIKGLVEEQAKLAMRLVEVNQLLDECYNMEIEVEE